MRYNRENMVVLSYEGPVEFISINCGDVHYKGAPSYEFIQIDPQVAQKKLRGVELVAVKAHLKLLWRNLRFIWQVRSCLRRIAKNK